MKNKLLISAFISLYLLSMSAIGYATCTITSRTYINTSPPYSCPTLTKKERNTITFSSQHFEYVNTEGQGECNSNLAVGDCWPVFLTPRETSGTNIWGQEWRRWHQDVKNAYKDLNSDQCVSPTISQTFSSTTHYCVECTNPGCAEGEVWSWELCDCVPRQSSPIIIDVLGDGFALTGAGDGVAFDIDGDGTPERLGWTVNGSDDAFLVLDRNHNNGIDDGKELFGNYTAQPSSDSPNGFLALAEFDKPESGGNSDGVIDNGDAIFSSLRLWQDLNHNGISEENELHPLAESGVAKLELDYKESRKTDQYGNQFRYRAKIRDKKGEQVGRWAWDVFLTTR